LHFLIVVPAQEYLNFQKVPFIGSMQKSVGNRFIIGTPLEANEVFEKPLEKQDKYQAV